MHKAAIAIVLALSGCGDNGNTAKLDAPALGTAIDAVFPDAPSACAAEVAFDQAHGCENDGSVEWCIPDNQPALITELQAIEPAIHCAAGGGRAMCSATPGLLLCSYPTAFPDQCIASHGAMTDATWADMCAIAAKAEVTAIVPTILE